MAGRKKKSVKPVARNFNVIYEDGSLSSNRRVPGELLIDPFGVEDMMELARAAIEKQDREIEERSGVPKPEINEIKKAGLRCWIGLGTCCWRFFLRVTLPLSR